MQGVAEEGWIDFARVLKYFRHTLEGFARDGGGGGVGGVDEGRRSFAQVLKYLRHILEGFCKEGDGEGGRRVLEDFCRDHKISQTPMGGLLQGS